MHSSFSSSPGGSLADTAPNPADGKTIAWIPISEKDSSALIAFCCWQQKFRMLWRRETGPKRPGRACPIGANLGRRRSFGVFVFWGFASPWPVERRASFDALPRRLLPMGEGIVAHVTPPLPMAGLRPAAASRAWRLAKSARSRR
jgi:hypothetical protein